MCGIAGHFGAPVGPDVRARMMSALRRRGPDAQHVAVFDGAGQLSLNGLPAGVPVTGLRLAGMPATDPTLGVGPRPDAAAFALARPWPNGSSWTKPEG